VQPSPAIDDLPGYRRRFRIEPASSIVLTELEDDFHCMRVALHHDGRLVTDVEAEIARAPWTTCPGAVAELKRTFVGVPLTEFSSKGDKRINCTHLYDLAMLGAAHAFDDGVLVYDVLVSDPIDGKRCAELRRNGVRVLSLTEMKGRIVEPIELEGRMLLEMRPWIDSLEPGLQEAARVLQWASLVAHGRTIPMERQSDATRMPSNCYTFQPHRAAQAQRVGEIRDFSTGAAQPLDRRRAAAGLRN
jgi:hypothetical protein